MKRTQSFFEKTTATTASPAIRPMLLLAMFFWTAGSLFSQTTWNGSAGTNWSTPANWSAGVPDVNDDVTIPNVTNDPVIGAAGAVAKSVTVQSGSLLTVAAAGTLAINGSIAEGILNQGTVQNNGVIHIGNISALGTMGMANEGVFNNNTGAQLNIDRSTQWGLNNLTGSVFTNQGTIRIGSIAAVGQTGLNNTGTFHNNAGGQINIDRAWHSGLYVFSGTFNNHASIVIGGVNGSDIYYGLINYLGTFTNNTGAQISIDRCGISGIYDSHANGTFNNAGNITIGALGSIDELVNKDGAGTFNNNSGGVLKGTGEIAAHVFVNNGGALMPGYSPGIMTFTESENFSNSTLSMEVNGAGTPGVHFDQVVVNGTATLGGTLALSINYAGANGDEVTILSAAALSGTFSSVTGLPANWNLYYSGDRVVLIYGGNFWTGSAGTNWNTAGNWSLGAVPNANQNVIIPNVANDPVIGAAGAVAKSVWVRSGGLLTIAAAGTLAINGATTQSILNQGTIQNNGTLHIGNTSGAGPNGIANEGVINNNTGGQINIDRCTNAGIYTFGGTINNAGTITTGGVVAVTNLLSSHGTLGVFNNNTGGLFKGTGTVGANHFVNAGGTVAPGYSPGKMTFTESENFSNSTLSIEVNGTGTPGVNFDQVVVSGTATLGGTLALSINYSGVVGDGVVIVSATAISGTFSSVTGLPANWNINYSSTEVVLSYGASAASTWTGSVSTAWNTAGNWSAGLPGAATIVTIPNVTNDPVISTSGVVVRAITVQSGGLLTVAAAGTLAINGSIAEGMLNQGTVQNNGVIHIGNISALGTMGMVNEGVFNNNTGAQLNIDRSSQWGLNNFTGGVFTNQGTIRIGSIAAVGQTGLNNTGTFHNNAGGQINIDRAWHSGLYVFNGTFNNHSSIVIGGVSGSNIYYGLINYLGTFTNNTGAQIIIDRCGISGIYDSHANGTFNNAGNITIGALGSIDELVNLDGAGTFNNNSGGVLKGTGEIAAHVFVNNGGTLMPGYSPGIMTFTGSENFTNSNLVIEVNGAGTPGIHFDQVVVNGTATLGGTLALSINYAPSNGQEVIIVSATAISGTFSPVTGLPANWSLVYTSNAVKLSYCSTAPVPVPPVTINNGLHFDGSNDFVGISNNTCPPVPFVNGGDAITIEYWFKGANNHSAVRLQPASSDNFIVAGWSGKHILSNDGGTTGIAVGAGYNDGNWHHIAMTWQRNTTNGFKSYLDGQLVEQRNSANTALPVISSGLCLGAYSGSSEFMQGTLDEVRIWNVARTQADIQASLNNLSLPQTGLQVYYKFNHGTAGGANAGINAVLNSADANAFTGVLNNFALSGATSNWVGGQASIPTWYADADGDGFGNPNVSQQVAQQPPGYVADNTDCDDNDPLEKPGQVWYDDTDNDGYGQTGAASITQCLRPTGYRTASELTSTTGDCNDANAAIKPGATEVCDGVDNDCDNSTDEGGLITYYRDLDGDTFGNSAMSQQACSQPTGYVTNSTDCDDNDPLEKPGQVWYKDADNDGYGQTGASTIAQCLRPTGYKVASELTSTTGDCNDNSAAIKPGATEVCDGVDNDCDNSTDEGVLTTYYRDMDGDSFGNPIVTQQACSQPTGYVANSTDCDDNDALEKPGQVWYDDTDNDGYGQTGASSITQCLRPVGYRAASELTATTGDCSDGNAAINPGATEVCDGIDNNCNNATDEGDLTTWYRDMDGDGFGNSAVTQQSCSQPTGYVVNSTDCDDNDPLEKPGQVWYDDTDNDGYGQTDAASITQCLRPVGYKAAVELSATTGDCNDTNAAINPVATELCDGVDNDCDNQTDESGLTVWYRDLDNDGFGDPVVTQTSCTQPSGYVSGNTDCDDNDALEKPGQVWYKDADGDDYSDGTTLTQCLRPTNYYVASELIAISGDCNDHPATGGMTNPAAAETCDGVDNNCDGITDEGVQSTYYRDLDGDGFGNPGSTTSACSQPVGYVINNLDCNDASAVEKPGQVWYKDADNDGYAQTGAGNLTQCLRPTGYRTASELTATTGDCNDDSATGGLTNPAATEICDGMDNDCDDQTDEGVKTEYFADTDGDGFGDPNSMITECSQPAGYVTNNEDCDDADDAVNPSEEEVCDSKDNDCNGVIDDIGGSTAGNWNSGDVGGAGGSANFPPCNAEPTDIFTLSATGFSTTSSDKMHAVYQQLCGNGEIIARVLNVENSGWAGIMLRETLDPGSKKVALKTQLTFSIRREIRTVSNGAASILNFNRPQHTWLRLTRSGNNFVGYTSTNGSNWSFAFSATISMTGCIYAGVFAESINNSITTTAVFDQVAVTGANSLLAAPAHAATIAAALDFEVYPNPTAGEVTVDLRTYANHAVRLHLYDLRGNILQVIERDAAANATERLDLSDYPDGVFFIRVHAVGAENVVSQRPDVTKRVVLTR